MVEAIGFNNVGKEGAFLFSLDSAETWEISKYAKTRWESYPIDVGLLRLIYRLQSAPIISMACSSAL